MVSRRVRNSSMTVHGSPDAIEPDQAAEIFAELTAAEDLALRFPADGCYARTHLMVRRLLDRGLAPSKVWAFAASATDLLWTETPDHPDGRVQWQYHVAPVLVVRGPDGGTREMVFDPLLFDRQVPVEEWRSALRHTDSGANGSWGTAAARTRGDRILARAGSPRRDRRACARDARRVPDVERLTGPDWREQRHGRSTDRLNPPQATRLQPLPTLRAWAR